MQATVAASGWTPPEGALDVFTTSCWVGPRGAWSLYLDTLCRAPELVLEGGEDVALLGRWGIMYADIDGSSATYVPATSTGALGPDLCVHWRRPGNIAAEGGGPLVVVSVAHVYDFDGDGHAELFLSATDRSVRDHPEMGGFYLSDDSNGGLLQFRGGQIARYGPAQAITRGVGPSGLEDVDGDGRPDLYLNYYGLDADTRPRRVAHALPDGTFSTTDESARRATLAQCPEPGSALAVIAADGTLDWRASQTEAVCARLRGASAREIYDRIERECRPSPDAPGGPACALHSWALNLVSSD
jgi:hypothetical protein